MYAITGGSSVNDARNNHSGTALGLDLVYPRSSYHWRAMVNFVRGQLGQTGGNLEVTSNAQERFGILVQETILVM